MCFAGPDPIFALYSHVEKPGKAIDTGFGVEESDGEFGLGICPEYLMWDHVFLSKSCRNITYSNQYEIFLNFYGTSFLRYFVFTVLRFYGTSFLRYFVFTVLRVIIHVLVSNKIVFQRGGSRQ